MAFWVGGTARIDWTVKENVNGDLVDPSIITFSVADPNGSTTSYTYGTDESLKRLSTGSYYISVPLSVSGVHTYKIQVLGGVADVEYGRFLVTAKPIPF